MSAPSNPVARVMDEWVALRQVMAEQDAADHPDILDRFDRVWSWVSGDLYRHDDTLAHTRMMIDHPDVGLPSPLLADNPNYAGLCDICRSEWPTS